MEEIIIKIEEQRGNTVIEKNWQELVKPNKIEIKEDQSGKNVSRLTVEPMEKGFGLTIGNSLRRILLSSLQGSACLLYTSPSPRDRTRSRMPSSA